ncbi:UbiA family prenyltransferase [Aliiroseovarius sp.]|uniref:UbiA family prenyltransferase n=1 Tax=Aliiroseovarius sp. TaxID=1872442 RepID=UPI002616473A|nr:UbiA family prenyltransferase [Aliiroseovarius sp.]
MADGKPLVLDVDGTFLRTDMLVESFWAGMGKRPLATLAASLRNLGNRPRLKAELARIGQPRTDLMPVKPEIAELARVARGEGREVVFASASDRGLVEQLAADHGLEGRVFGSEAGVNLKGVAKAEALVAAYGEGGFDYAGNEAADRAVWERADTAIVVGDAGSARALAAAGKPVQSYDGAWRWSDLARALRPHQWVKNILLLLPMVAAHDFTWATLGMVILGMICFSAAASSIYVANDLLDLEADRLHESKCRRPFAGGSVPLIVGMAAGAGAGTVALAGSALLGPGMLSITGFYMLLSLAYSLRLKRFRWIDIVILAGLYTLRVVAGAAVTGLSVSGFLIGVIFPAFVALGAVKRLTEVTRAETDERLPGRGYARGDRSKLLNLALAGVAGAVLSFLAYGFSPQAIGLYPDRVFLWLAALPMLLWLIRMVRLGYEGRQDYDPILFAMRDKRGIGLLLICLASLFFASGLWEGVF